MLPMSKQCHLLIQNSGDDRWTTVETCQYEACSLLSATL